MNDETGIGSRAAQLAQLAAKASKIAAAASVSGPYGAAVVAVKQFLPLVIKIVVIALIVVLLLPVLIFAGIPHFLFGWMGSTDAEVMSMTDMASHMGGIYEQFDEIIRLEGERLAEEIAEQYESENVEITVNVSNMGMEWFVAIMSVYYEQDLTRINEDVVRRMIADCLVYATTVQGTVIQIDIIDLDANALMIKLEFTDQQRQWAEFLVQNAFGYQVMDKNSADYIEGQGVNYGDITFTEGATKVVYFNQLDQRWAHVSYGKTGTIGISGCGPTALAIVVSSLTDKTVTPIELAEWAYRNGYYVEHQGSRRALIPDGGKRYGLTVESIEMNDAQKIVDALSSGKLVIAIMGKGHFTSRGHFIVLRGVTADGKILVADPVSVKRSEQQWNLELILSEVSRSGGNTGPLWVIG